MQVLQQDRGMLVNQVYQVDKTTTLRGSSSWRPGGGSSLPAGDGNNPGDPGQVEPSQQEMAIIQETQEQAEPSQQEMAIIQETQERRSPPSRRWQ